MKRSASVPKAGMPSGKSLRVCLAMLSACFGFIRPVGALGDQLFQGDAVDQVDRVEHVALGLAHLLAFGCRAPGRDVDVPERHLAGEVLRHHHHARDPEEDDVEAGDQHAWRAGKVASSGVLSGQPSVENGHSAEENQVSSTSSSWRQLLVRAGLLLRLFLDCVRRRYCRPRRTRPGCGGPTTAGARCTSPGCCPATGCRCVVQFSGTNFISPVADHVQAALGQAFHGHEPLVGEHRLDHACGCGRRAAPSACAAWSRPAGPGLRRSASDLLARLVAVQPWYSAGAWSLILASSVRMLIGSRWWRCPTW